MSDLDTELRSVISAVNLQSIGLVEVSARRNRELALTSNLDVNLGHGARFVERGKSGDFVVLARIDVKISQQQKQRKHRDRKKPLAADLLCSVMAEFELRYALPKELKVTSEVLQKFANVNAIYNVWPYWREIVQNLTTRMDFPPLTLPVFRIGVGTERNSSDSTKLK